MNTCPMGVFDIEDFGKGNIKIIVFNRLGKKKATVANASACTMCRECIRDEDFTKAIELGKTRDHYICNIKNYF